MVFCLSFSFCWFYFTIPVRWTLIGECILTVWCSCPTHTCFVKLTSARLDDFMVNPNDFLWPIHHPARLFLTCFDFMIDSGVCSSFAVISGIYFSLSTLGCSMVPSGSNFALDLHCRRVLLSYIFIKIACIKESVITCSALANSCSPIFRQQRNTEFYFKFFMGLSRVEF